jgi:transcriptional regulator with XRE-family HTH domain
MTELEGLQGMITHKNSINMINSENEENTASTTFKALQRETSVYKYYVVLKEDSLTKQGFLDLEKVPKLYISGAGQFLKNLRKKNSLSQQDIATILEVNRVAMEHWENSRNKMPLQKLVKISEILGISRDTIYYLIDSGKITTKNNLPVNFEKFRNIAQYFNPNKDENKARIILLKHCPEKTINKIMDSFKVIPRSHGRKGLRIACRELYNFLTTFFNYFKVPKIHPPLTNEVKGWYNDDIDLKRAVIMPSLQSDGTSVEFEQYHRLSFCGYNKHLHDYFVDAMYFEYDKMPTSYFIGDYRTEYRNKSIKKIRNSIMSLAGNTKTSPAKGQTAEEYLQETQPHLHYLINAPKTEQKIAIRIWASTEGSIMLSRSAGHVYPRLVIACAHPDLAIQLQQIAKCLNMKFSAIRSNKNWSGIGGINARDISSCIEFLKFGGFIKGVKIGGHSKYHEGIPKNVLFLGILEFKIRQLESISLKKLPTQQIHHEINKIIENRDYKSADYYINYFS